MVNQGFDARRYAELAGFDGGWRDTWWNLDFVELMARRWGLGDVRRALDVGAGHGHWGRLLLPFLAADARLEGVDVEPAFCEAAAARARELGLGERVRYEPADAASLPFPDGSFDLVTCQTVLIHVADPRAVLAEMVRVLRPGGRLALAEPNNLANVAALTLCEPRPSREEWLAFLELEWTAEAGKAALGEGHYSIGEELPGLLAELGLEGITAHHTDKCALLVPPYAGEHQRLELDTQAAWAREGTWMFCGGTEETARRFHLAGGGTEEAFAERWAAVRAWLARFAAAAEAGTVSGTRGVSHYLVSGLRPR